MSHTLGTLLVTGLALACIGTSGCGGVVECEPVCQGRDCGPDSCGGECGSCQNEQICDEETGRCLSSGCGDGNLDPGEHCDPPQSCPVSCDDSDACTVDSLEGSADDCSAHCRNEPIASCLSGDGCCLAWCTAQTDSDCPPTCGIADGICPGNCVAGPDPDCQAECGDGVCSGNQGETCPGCQADCDSREVVCGNGECQTGEDATTCLADCGPWPWPEDWLAKEQEALDLINAHRAAGTDCPTGAKNPVDPMTMDPAMRRAAQLHAWDLTYSNYFSHESCNGRTPWDRAGAQGGSTGGEGIAWAGSSPESGVSAWMASTAGHCDGLMNGSVTFAGLGYGGGGIWVIMQR